MFVQRGDSADLPGGDSLRAQWGRQPGTVSQVWCPRGLGGPHSKAGLMAVILLPNCTSSVPASSHVGARRQTSANKKRRLAKFHHGHRWLGSCICPRGEIPKKRTSGKFSSMHLMDILYLHFPNCFLLGGKKVYVYIHLSHLKNFFKSENFLKGENFLGFNKFTRGVAFAHLAI